MRVETLALAVSAGLCASVAAAGSTQPPMGQFNGAFYTCDQGQAFAMSYDSRAPTDATLTTSNNSKQYQLKRTSGVGMIQFSNGTVNVSITADGAKVEGTVLKLTHCRLKNTT